MSWNLSLSAFGLVFGLVSVLALLGSGLRSRQVDSPLASFLLADARLGRSSVVNLLLSSSFGLNSLFYQVWLGYTVGAWALIAQGAWAISFFLLAPYSLAIRSERSLHALLGKHFGSGTRVIAGCCSLAGISYMIGWEAGIGRATFTDLFNGSAASQTSQGQVAGAWLVAAVVLGTLLYTVLGGLKGNASADIFLNVVKSASVTIAAVFLFYRIGAPSGVALWHALFPNIETMKRELGVWGLITNVAFSLAWQFVDTSTWQSVIAGAENRSEDTVWNLRLSGIAIFIAPGIVGTLLGAFLVGAPNVSSSNILGRVIALTPGSLSFTQFIGLVVIIGCVMSLIDGLFLASAYTFVVDILHPDKSLTYLDANPERAERLVSLVRIALIGNAIVAVWGVWALLAALHVSLFDFVYVFIIAQLALIGPVIAAITFRRRGRISMWIVIIAGLVFGFGSVALGSSLHQKWMVDGAGTFTIAASCALAFLTTSPRSSNNSEEFNAH